MESTTLPETYNALIAGAQPKVESRPLPKPGNNQILVKVAYAPINPSDIASMYGKYVNKDSELVGLEGAGTVVALGENLKVPFTVGQKVHLRGPGTMGQYIVVDCFAAWPVQGDLSLENAASHIVNPGTCVYMAALATEGGHKAIIHTAGSSALGRMIIRYFKEKGIKTINIVRRDDFTEELKGLGADYVLNSTAPDFEAQLKEIAEKEQATIAFDAIAGDFTGKVVTAQPAGSICYVYGGLGGRAVTNLSIMELFKGKRVSGLYLTNYVTELAKTGKIREFFQEIHSRLGTTFSTNVHKVFKLEEIAEALAYYKEHSSKGKILLQPNH